ncbi:MAG TPA: hypothetical protein VE987_15300 [Polyangiaceae bacterium]|nr:hypothetical protein [Polyangiaceae bacterium]
MRTRSLLLLAFVTGCGGGATSTGGPDAGVTLPDESAPAPATDAAAPNGPATDMAGNATAADMAKPSPDLAPAQPLPQTEFLNGAQNLGTPVIDASPDESGNLWVVAPDALYIRRAGSSSFRKYTNADGLHIYSYITAVAGGAQDEGWVGLEGVDAPDPNVLPLDQQQEGHAEHVHLMPDGSITSLHYADLHTDVSSNYWENPSARRLLYVHSGAAAGHLFMGMNHGIDHVFDDAWGDHIHVEVYLPDGSGTYGEWYGLAVQPDGMLWTCGKEACGLQRWSADPRAWVNAGYKYAFTAFQGGHDLMVPAGYREDFVGTAIGADGTVYMLSRPFGLAAWLPGNYDYQHIHGVTVPGLGTPVDIVADPDGTLWIADTGQVLRFDPATGKATPFSVPSGDIRRLYMDTRSTPRTLYVATGDGLAIYRGK